MADGAESWRNRRTWLRALLAAGAVLLLALFLPPMVSVNHYKARITNLISRSLGRPVRLSNVEVRLLPWPGFVLYDLSVAEDPAYGAEPVLHANKVTASIRLLTLLVGRVEIGSISVDEASLNVVRAGPGVWNLEALFRTAAAQTGARPGAASPVRLPTLEATDSRIDFKNGAEKLPFSLVNADLTVWQANPGEWRVRMRGQPARTDVSLSLEDTGEVRMEASVHQGPALREMPIHLDLDWREAQFGQLARLVTGSDSGWRGGLAGEMHVDGTADAAHIAMRLRAGGVHREEFVPVSPLDFDANCNFLYHYSARSLENVVCDSPLGDGRIHLTGSKPGAASPPNLAVELTSIPVGALLDALRTLRSGLQPDLEAAGSVSGKIVYAERSAAVAPPAPPAKSVGHHGQKISPVESGPLSGSLTVTNFVLTGGGLARPIEASRIIFTPVLTPVVRAVAAAPALPRSSPSPSPPADANSNDALAGTVAIPAGGAVPLTFTLHFSRSGYEIAVRGQAAIPRAREIAHAAGIPATAALESLAGDPIAVDLIAAGPWIPQEAIPPSEATPPSSEEPEPLPVGISPGPLPAIAPSGSDSLTGTVTLRNANWKADYLAGHLGILIATLHLDPGGSRWDPIDFAYGQLNGTATLTLPASCPLQPASLCPEQPAPALALAFVELDTSSLQTALLGARTPSTLLSTLIDRLHPSTAPPWPHVLCRVNAETMYLGPVVLDHIDSNLELLPDGVNIKIFTGDVLDGNFQITGTLHKPDTGQDKPAYSLKGYFENIDTKQLGRLLGLRWTGSAIDGKGDVDLSGYTGADLAASAKGSLHIEARYGSIAAAREQSGNEPDAANAPAALTHFDHLTADAAIANGAVTLGPNQFVSGGRKRSVASAVSLTDPPTVSFEAAKPAEAKR